MHYIRFLKAPRLETDSSGSSVKALVTLTSDLSDGFYPLPASLLVELLDRQLAKDFTRRDAIMKQHVQWQAGMRALPICCRVPPYCKVRRDLRLRVQPAGELRINPVWEDGRLVMAPIVGVETADICWSQGAVEPERLMLRICRFVDYKEESLCVWEEMGETIAGHVWFVAAFYRVKTPRA